MTALNERGCMNRTKACLAVAGVTAGIACAPAAHSNLMLSGTVNGANFCASDNNIPCNFGTQLSDTSATIGILGLGSSATPVMLNGVSILGSVQTQVIGPPGILNSTSLTILNLNNTPASATVAVSGTGFAGPSTEAFLAGSGTWQSAIGSSIALAWYNDPLNSQGAETSTDTPGQLLSTFSDTATLLVDSFSTAQGPIAVNNVGPYSMTFTFALNLVGGGSLISRGQNEVELNTPVPEPETYAMLLAGLGLVGFVARRRNQKAA